MPQVIIVGGGLTGQIIAKKLRKEGHMVTVFDRKEKEAGSPASGGHIKPSWLTSIYPADLERSLQLLDKLYGLEPLVCDYKGKPVDMFRVDVDRILQGATVQASITALGDGWVEYTPEGNTQRRAIGTVIVAAGVWSSELVPEIAGELSGKKGMSWVFHGGTPVTNMIKEWAPYKQIVRTSHGPGKVWIGDGTAIKTANWTEKREADSLARVSPHFPERPGRTIMRRGIRPYLSDGLRRVSPNTWLATGGAKSGTVMAGVWADRLAEALR